MRRTVEFAHSFQLGLCDDPKCRALHFKLEDDTGTTFAQMTIGVEHVPRVIEKMQSYAYAIAAGRGEDT